MAIEDRHHFTFLICNHILVLYFVNLKVCIYCAYFSKVKDIR